MIAWDRIISPPPPSPWMPRPMISMVMSVCHAGDHRADEEAPRSPTGTGPCGRSGHRADRRPAWRRSRPGCRRWSPTPCGRRRATRRRSSAARCYDRLVERGQQHRGHQPGKDQAEPAGQGVGGHGRAPGSASRVWRRSDRALDVRDRGASRSPGMSRAHRSMPSRSAVNASAAISAAPRRRPRRRGAGPPGRRAAAGTPRTAPASPPAPAGSCVGQLEDGVQLLPLRRVLRQVAHQQPGQLGEHLARRRRPGRHELRGELVRQVGRSLHDRRVLAREVVEEGARRHAGGRADHLHGDLVEAVLTAPAAAPPDGSPAASAGADCRAALHPRKPCRNPRPPG